MSEYHEPAEISRNICSVYFLLPLHHDVWNRTAILQGTPLPRRQSQVFEKQIIAGCTLHHVHAATKDERS
jgi:hypothetical protein